MRDQPDRWYLHISLETSYPDNDILRCYSVSAAGRVLTVDGHAVRVVFICLLVCRHFISYDLTEASTGSYRS